MADAAAKAAEVPAAELRRAVMLHGDLGDVAATAMAGGVPALREIGLQVGRGIRPMLASPAADIDVAMEKLSPAAVEWKLDGIRAQVHRDGSDVAVFSRTLDDITERVPGIVEAALALPVRSVVLDGEAIALRDDGRPHAFQDTASRGHRLQALYLRRAPPRRRGRARRARRRARRAPRRRRARGAARPPPRRRRCRGRRRRARRGARDGPRGRDREVARRALRRRPPRRRLAEGQAGAHARPRHPRRRVGPRPPPRLALQPPPRRAPRHRAGAVRDARQDVQGAHRQDAPVADRARCSSSPPTAATGSSTSAPSSSSRSRSTASSAARATRAASRCASRACCATGPTSAPRRPTRSRRCWRWARRQARHLGA